jgi:eukaryotic-like serine/threonine-protein kinase
MAEQPILESVTTKGDEQRLAHALVSRGLVTREEVQECLGVEAGPGVVALLKRLVKAGYLTRNQAQRAAHEMPLLLGEQIPGYELFEKLGHGAMGTVYKARQTSMNRLVAVKTLHPRLAGNPEYIKRFMREAHLAAKLSHNNIVQAIDVGSAGELYYFVMEYVSGTTIKDELEGGKVYEEKEAVDIILQIAQAVQHAWRRGLIHRDIKPANIIITLDGIAKLSDLGVARETDDAALARAEKGLAIGTPFYISPEQARGDEDIDVRADIYSLGATLYHMVTGQPPFPGPGVEEVLKAHMNEELTPPDHLNLKLSSGLGEVVEVMMTKDREQRYRNPDDLIIDLEYLLSGAPPRLARQKIQAAMLEALAEGEAAEEEDTLVHPNESAIPWLVILGGLLGLSVIVNLLLVLRR